MTGERTVSVIIPTFRRRDGLRRVLDALAGLDWPATRLEVLVVDDDAGASLAPALDAVRDRLNVRALAQHNAGPAAARNRGAARAEGELLAFTDDDCAPRPGWLRDLADALGSDADAGAGGLTTCGGEDLAPATAQRIVAAGYARLNVPGGPARFLTSNNLLLPSCGFRAIGGFDVRLRTSEDRDLCARWIGSGRSLLYVPDAEVEHHHAAGVAEFCRQHLAYARGARRFHVLQAARVGRRPEIEPGFYADLLRRPLGPDGGSRAKATALIALWLGTCVGGYAYEAASGRSWLAEPAAEDPASVRGIAAARG